MGIDIHVKVAKYNTSTNLYKELQLFRKRKPDEYDYNPLTGDRLPWTEFKEIYIDLGRDYEMFDGMKNGTDVDGYGFFPWRPINSISLEPSFEKKMEKEMKIDGVYDFYEINFSDLHNYCYNYPTVVDYESDEWDKWKPGDPVPQKENPIKEVVEKIEKFISIADDDYNYSPYSFYKVIFYFDC